MFRGVWPGGSRWSTARRDKHLVYQGLVTHPPLCQRGPTRQSAPWQIRRTLCAERLPTTKGGSPTKKQGLPNGEALSFQLRFAELSGEFLRLAQAGIGLFGFLEADIAVAVLVQQLELLGRAEELARRHIAVTVAVHLAEPQRAG